MISNIEKTLTLFTFSKYKLNINFSELLVFISWFSLILITSLYSRFYYYDISINYAKLLIFISLFFGLILILTNRVIRLNTSVLVAIAIIYLHALFSDPSKVAVLSYSAFYCIVIHFLCVNKYQVIFKQYLYYFINFFLFNFNPLHCF